MSCSRISGFAWDRPLQGRGARQPCVCPYVSRLTCGRKTPKRQPKERPNKSMLAPGTIHAGVESPFAWLRLAAAAALGTIGSVGMWAVPVVLPAVQADFGVARADASLPYTLAMVGFAVGGVLMGRLSDRFGVLARHCGRHRRLRQLCRGHHLAAGPAALCCELRLAGNPYRGRLGVRAYQL